MDWSKCIICQRDDVTSDLAVIKNSNRNDEQKVYKTFIDSAKAFKSKIGETPVPLNDQCYDETFLLENNATWHKKCRVKFNDLKLERALAKKRKSDSKTSDSSASPVKTRCTRNVPKPETPGRASGLCLFCDKPHTSNKPLTHVSSEQVDSTIRTGAVELNDTNLMVKVADRDLRAMEAQYHLLCYVAFKRKYDRFKSSKSDSLDIKKRHSSMALAHVVGIIEEKKEEWDSNKSDGILSFNMPYLTKLYNEKMSELGYDNMSRVHSTRLRERITAAIPNLKPVDTGKILTLVYKQDIDAAVIDAREAMLDQEEIALSRTARRLRREQISLSDSDNKNSPYFSQILFAFIHFVLYGYFAFETHDSPQCIKTICDLLAYHTKKNTKGKIYLNDFKPRNMSVRIPSTLNIIALKLHLATRNKLLINFLSNLGVCINYKRVINIIKAISNEACAKYIEDKIVCPIELNTGVYTSCALDNIDHNPTSTTADHSFHGTALTVMQHPSDDCPGTTRGRITIPSERGNVDKIITLPAFYTNVPVVSFNTKNIVTPIYDELSIPQSPCEAVLITPQESAWLQHVDKVINTDTSGTEIIQEDANVPIQWAAYHASQMRLNIRPPTKISLLPLFTESSQSFSTIKHSLDIFISITEHLNGDQTPMVVCDQPLYAICKMIQWLVPYKYGENKIVMMLGGLHIEMNAWKMIGKWLKDSGIVELLVECGVLTDGRCDSILQVSHLKRTRKCYMIVAAALGTLQIKAYKFYESTFNKSNSGNPLSFSDWSRDCSEKSPQFMYADLSLKFILNVLQFVRSIREANFSEYIQSLPKLNILFLALDHGKYGRWLAVHYRDMVTMKEKHPNTYAEFKKGNFTALKSRRSFSAIALDEAHEQENAAIKGCGGIIGLTNDAQALQQWVLSGPEIRRIVNEFENFAHNEDNLVHRDSTPSIENKFKNNVTSYVNQIEVCGSPFLEKSGDLYNLCTRNVADRTVIETVRTVTSIGLEQYTKFVNERLLSNEKKVTDHMPYNKLSLFSSTKKNSKTSTIIKGLTNDFATFTNMCLTYQVRGGDLKKFFTHENQLTPPALSVNGEMQCLNKSALLSRLHPAPLTRDAPDVEVIIIDGPALVHMMLPTSETKTFSDYKNKIFIPYVKKCLTSVTRVDIVWDIYTENSIKSATREKRGQGVRRKVNQNSPLPDTRPSWHKFLSCGENKTEFFAFLAQSIKEISIEDKIVISSCGPDVVINASSDFDATGLAPCTHEEADTRMLLHAAHAVNNGANRIQIRTVDTDVVVLSIAAACQLKLAELWVAFGTGQNFGYIPAHEIARDIGEKTAKALPMFHALSGCDSVSSFSGYGKKKIYDAWKVFPALTHALIVVTKNPNDIDKVFSIIERFIVILYRRSSDKLLVNEEREHLYIRENRSLEKIPPTQGALLQHVKRAVYQGSIIWGQMFIRAPELPCPTDWGYTLVDNKLQPHWTDLPLAQDVDPNLNITCKCKKGCTGNCSCRSKKLLCTIRCVCEGTCRDLDFHDSDSE